MSLIKQYAVFQLIEIGNPTQLLFVELAEGESPLHFEQRINERLGTSTKLKLLGIEGQITAETLPTAYIAFRARTREIAQSIVLRGAWPSEQISPRPGVLLLEADDQISSVVSKGLANDFDVNCVSNIADAELVAQGAQVDVLLLDVRSLGDRALLGIQRLKASQPLAKVVLISEIDRWAVNTTVSVMLNNGYLQKPFTLRLLLKTLRAVLGSPTAAQQYLCETS
jgi:hypothetical protein